MSTPIKTRLLDFYRKLRYGKTWYDHKGRPLKEVFSEIYRRKLWGRDGEEAAGEFYSGPGSDLRVSGPYIEAVGRYIRENKIASVVDLGCGDFRVGSKLIGEGISYHGVDVVPDLIRHLESTASGPEVKFSCRNIVEDPLPAGQLCLVRQVFQHLSNDQILAVLAKLESFDHVIVTEHFPAEGAEFVPNRDISHGPETRVDFGSGLFLDQPPFNRKVAAELCEVVIDDRTRIKTILLDMKS